MPYFIQATLAAALFCIAQSASAVPSLGDLTGVAALDDIEDDGTELFSFTDTSTVLDDSDLIITLRNAGGQNRVFIYDDIFPAIELTVFDFADPVFATQTLSYNVVQNSISNGLIDILMSQANGLFGIGIEHSDGNKYYSQNSLNADGFDHMLAYNVSGITGGGLFGLGNYVFAFEDLPNGGDQDYDDVLVNATDIVASPVEAPMTMVLLGLGILGMSLFVKRAKA